MAPTLTDTQQRVDQIFDDYVKKWNGFSREQQTGPDGADLKTRIEDLVRHRNGDEAWYRVAQGLNYGKPTGEDIRRHLDSFPRVDGPPAAPAAPMQPSAPAPAVPLAEYINDPTYNAEPGDGRLWLPGNATLPQLSDSDHAALADRDAAIQKINSDLFAVDPALAWKPTGAELPATGTNISTLGGTHDQAVDLLGKFAAAVEALNKALTDGAVEPIIADERSRVRPGLDALGTAAADAKNLPALVSRGAIAANDGFHQLRGENLDIRREMAVALDTATARAAAEFAINPLGLTPEVLAAARLSGKFATLPDVSQPSRIGGVAEAVNEMTTLTGRVTTPGRLDSQDVTTRPVSNRSTETSGGGGGLPGVSLPGTGDMAAVPAAGAVPAIAPATPAGAGSKPSTDDIAKILSQLGNSASPLAQQAAQLPQQLAQQAAQIPQQAANAIRNAAQNPNSVLRNLRGADPQNAQLAAAKQAAATDAATDRAAATQVAYTPPNPAAAAALGAPGSTARPNQLDATGKPVDKDGDGKVDKDAVPLSKKTVKPFDLSIPAGGQNVMVKGVPDPRIGEMMLDMSDARSGNPMSVLEAAKAAGMDIPALGDPMDPDKAKVGDAVIGDTKSGLYMGDGKVLTSSGTVENMDDVLGKSGFVSHIPLPELPDNPPGEQSGDRPADKPGAITVGDTTPPPTTNNSGAAAAMASTSEAGPAPEPAKSPPPAPAAGASPAPAPAAPAPAAPAPAPAAPAPAAPAPAPAAPTAPSVAADTTLLAAESPTPAGGGLPKQVPYEGRPLGG